MTVVTIVIWLIVAPIGLILFGHILVWLLYVPAVARAFGETMFLPAQRHRSLEDGEDVTFTTRDGVRLEGTYLATGAGRRKGVIVFCHELNGNRWTTVPYTKDLRRRGFDIFTFDFRNHGSSENLADYQPMPWVTTSDLADMQAALDYLCTRGDADPRGIGVMGLSRGGTAALCAAAENPHVRAVVVDGACPTERMQIYYLRRFMRSFISRPWMFSWLPDLSLRATNAWARLLVQRQRNCRFVSVDQAAKRVRQPVMLIHGQRDSYVPVDVVRALRKGMPVRTRLWVIPKARHNGAISIATTAYHQRVARFFHQHLAPVAEQYGRPAASRSSAAASGSVTGPPRRVPREFVAGVETRREVLSQNGR